MSVGCVVILSSLPLGWTGVVLAGRYQPLTLMGQWPLSVLFDPVLGDPGWPMVLCPLGLPVFWVAVLGAG